MTNTGVYLMGNSGTSDNCYADQPSACTEPSSVPCTNLSPGTKKACCPPLTSCADRPQGPNVRCEIAYPNLMALVDGSRPQSSSSSSASELASTSVSSSAATTRSVSSQSSTAAVSPTRPAETTPMVNPGSGQTTAATAGELPNPAYHGRSRPLPPAGWRSGAVLLASPPEDGKRICTISWEQAVSSSCSRYPEDTRGRNVWRP
ncbi:hypothetical protein PG997_001553 [Apiospora hydei]|uniref:Uncharacterized protein n=1 Tax=Apiospora hydei TaxID=1337664 RepID=A0ABR1XDW8_9PEZI